METNFKRPAADPRGNFSDFPASKLSTVAVKQGKKAQFAILQDADGKRHNATTGELSDLQERYPNVPILVNAENKIADINTDCHLNPEAVIGREEGILVV